MITVIRYPVLNCRPGRLNQDYLLATSPQITSRGSVLRIKYHGQKQRFVSSYNTGRSPSWREVMAGSNSRREPRGRNRSRCHGVVLLAGLLSVASHPAISYSSGPFAQGGTTHSGLGPSTLIIYQENALQTFL